MNYMLWDEFITRADAHRVRMLEPVILPFPLPWVLSPALTLLLRKFLVLLLDIYISQDCRWTRQFPMPSGLETHPKRSPTHRIIGEQPNDSSRAPRPLRHTFERYLEFFAARSLLNYRQNTVIPDITHPTAGEQPTWNYSWREILFLF